jgi:PAS domain S-box-containing protein
MYNELQSSYQENENIFRILIEESPSPVALYVGREMVIKLANPSMLKTWGKDASVIGKTYYEALPELEGQPIFKLLDDVFTSGIAYEATEYRVDLVMDGKLQIFYFNIAFKPLKNAEGAVWGIINTAADVTELVLTRQKLVSSDERIQFAIDSAELGTWDIDRLADIITWNNRCRELYGFAEGEYVSITNVRQYLHPDDAERITASVIKAIDPRSDGNYDDTFRIVYDGGKIRWIKCKGRAYFNEIGQCIRFAGTALDITSDLKAREEQQKLIAIVENAADIIGVADISANITYANKAAFKILGIERPEDALVPGINYYMPGDAAKLYDEYVPAVMKTGKWAGEINYRHFKTGEPIPVYLSLLRIDDPVTGKPLARASVARDLRPEKEAQVRQLYLSEQLQSTNIELNDQIKQFEFVTGFMPVQLWTAKTNGELDYVNQRTVDYFGLPAENIIGPLWPSLIHPDDYDACAHTWAYSLQTGDPYKFEFRLRDKEGNYKWHLARALPFYNDGEIVKWFGTNTDIDDQKQMQRQKDDFLGIASHELKTPVTSIKAYAQVLGAMLIKEGETKKAEMVLRMDAQVNRLTNLIGDLLDVTKINSGRLQFNKTWFDFNKAIRENMDDLQHTTNKHTLIEDFRATGEVYSDKDRIGQVITNLITNAIKYSPHADKIIVSTRIKGNEVTVCVQDFGIGIPTDKADRVFEQFYRVSGTKQHTFPGLGLGLYISSEIVKREGGRMWVNSVEGKGSTFCFALPVDDKTTNA